MTEMKVTLVERLARRMTAASQHTESPLTEQQAQQLLDKMFGALTADEQQLMAKVAATGVNMQRLQSYQKSYDEAMVNQAAAAAQAGEQAGEEAAPGGN